MRSTWWAPAGFAAVALLAAACGSSSSGPGGGSAASAAPSVSQASSKVLDTRQIGGATVLTNSGGRTLYWFMPDTSSHSACNGACVQHWSPVPGPATAGAGVTGSLGTITRSNGSKQATYDGHPLYTYVADTVPGQAKGNGLNLSGGVWHEMTASGATPAPAQSSAPAGGGGYGY
jgi:predicted lipoprotein with Yx(FWY)xxD motif